MLNDGCDTDGASHPTSGHQPSAASPSLEGGVQVLRSGTGDYMFSRLHRARGLPALQMEHWTTSETSLAKLARIGPVHLWTTGRIARTEIVFEHDGVLAWVALSKPNRVSCSFASSIEQVGSTQLLLSRVREALPLSDATDDVEVHFWFQDADGTGTSQERRLDAPLWADVAPNYPSAQRAALEQLIRTRDPGGRGQLLLWHGEPGTGKTWALRALSRAWSSWCDIEYVTDPDHFFGNPSYMMRVLVEGAVHRSHTPNDRWRLLILEDTGEMLSADAKSREGQRLSRLLNVVDGFIGQGLKLMILVTTNEELRSLHPAVSRPGRCAGVLEFTAFPAIEAQEWLFERGVAADLTAAPLALADLYAAVGGGPKRTRRRSVGFVGVR